MGPNMYLYEKAREEHYRDLQREIAKRRLLAHLHLHRLSRSRRVAGKLGVLLLKLGTLLLKLGILLKQYERSQPAFKKHVRAE